MYFPVQAALGWWFFLSFYSRYYDYERWTFITIIVFVPLLVIKAKLWLQHQKPLPYLYSTCAWSIGMVIFSLYSRHYNDEKWIFILICCTPTNMHVVHKGWAQATWMASLFCLICTFPVQEALGWYCFYSLAFKTLPWWEVNLHYYHSIRTTPSYQG